MQPAHHQSLWIFELNCQSVFKSVIIISTSRFEYISDLFQPDIFPINVTLVTLWVMLTLHLSPLLISVTQFKFKKNEICMNYLKLRKLATPWTEDIVRLCMSVHFSPHQFSSLFTSANQIKADQGRKQQLSVILSLFSVGPKVTTEYHFANGTGGVLPA